jgi:cytoskeletal protein RodZ
MKKFKFVFSAVFLLITANSFGEHDHEGFEEVHASPFSTIALILLVVAIVIAVIVLYTHFSRKTENESEELNETALKDSENNNLIPIPRKTAEELNETARKAASERFASGEISRKDYDNIFYKLDQLDDETIETAKLRLAKGEIDMEDYEEIYITLVNNQKI